MLYVTLTSSATDSQTLIVSVSVTQEVVSASLDPRGTARLAANLKDG